MPRRANLGIESYDAGYDSLAAFEAAAPYSKDARALSSPCPILSPGPRVLICHDNDGRPPTTTAERRYTFEHLQLATDYVHFSHRRVTIPPPEQIVAAHRNNARCLGTLIFEGEGGARDCVDLVTGPRTLASTSLLRVRTGPRGNTFDRVDLRVIDRLVELCLAKGFDGFLLNFEIALGVRDGEVNEEGRPIRRFAREHAAAIIGALRSHCFHRLEHDRRTAWTDVLRQEISQRVPNGAVIWYDSVTTQGDLAWQCRLTPLNAPFFLAAHSIFLDYHWRPEWLQDLPRLAKLIDQRGERALIGARGEANHDTEDVFVGIDVYGRGMLGGGGFDTHVALASIPKSLSIALFAPAWTRDELSRPRQEPFTTWEEDDSYFFYGGPRGPESYQRERARRDAEDEKRRRERGEEPYSRSIPPFRSVSDFLPIKRLPEAHRFFTCFARGGSDEPFRIAGQDALVGPWTDVGAQLPAADRSSPFTEGIRLTNKKSWIAGHSLEVNVAAVDNRSILLCSTSFAPQSYNAAIFYQSSDASRLDLLIELVDTKGVKSQRAVETPGKAPLDARSWQKLEYTFDTTEQITGIGIQLAQQASGIIFIGSLALWPASALRLTFDAQPEARRVESGEVVIDWQTNEVPVCTAIEAKGEGFLSTTLHPTHFVIPASTKLPFISGIRLYAISWSGSIVESDWVAVA